MMSTSCWIGKSGCRRRRGGHDRHHLAWVPASPWWSRDGSRRAVSVQVIDLQSLVPPGREAIAVPSAGVGAWWSRRTTTGSGLSGKDIAGVAERHRFVPQRVSRGCVPDVLFPTLASWRRTAPGCGTYPCGARSRGETDRSADPTGRGRGCTGVIVTGSEPGDEVTPDPSAELAADKVDSMVHHNGPRSPPCWQEKNTELPQGSVIASSPQQLTWRSRHVGPASGTGAPGAGLEHPP